MKSVAVVGEFASGKTTLANRLVEHFGYTRVSFAGRLKEMAAQAYNNGQPVQKDAQFEVWPLDQFGDSMDVDYISGRQLLQQLGQSVKVMDKLFWVKALMTDIDAGRYGPGPFVSDDCRFPYEADALRERGFMIVRIMTPEEVRMDRYELMYGRRPTQAEMNHPSETEVRSIEWDALVDGTIDPAISAAAIVAGAQMEAA